MATNPSLPPCLQRGELLWSSRIYQLTLALTFALSLLALDLYLTMQPHFLQQQVLGRLKKLFPDARHIHVSPFQLSLAESKLDFAQVVLPQGRVSLENLVIEHNPYLALVSIYSPHRLVISKTHIYLKKPTPLFQLEMGKTLDLFSKSLFPLREVLFQQVSLQISEGADLLFWKNFQVFIDKKELSLHLQNHILFEENPQAFPHWNGFSLKGKYSRDTHRWRVSAQIENLSVRASPHLPFGILFPKLAQHLNGIWEVQLHIRGRKEGLIYWQGKVRGYSTQWWQAGQKVVEKGEFTLNFYPKRFALQAEGLSQGHFFQLRGNFSAAPTSWQGIVRYLHPPLGERKLQSRQLSQLISQVLEPLSVSKK